MALNGRKTPEEVAGYLKDLAVAVLSTVTPEGKPYAAIVYFLTDPDLHFYFLTKSDTKKSKNLEANTAAALTIVDPHSPRTVQATGKVEEVEDAARYTEIINKISEENAKGTGFYWPPPLSKLDSEGDLVLYKFTPDWLRLADFTEPTSENIFYNVIPPEEI